MNTNNPQTHLLAGATGYLGHYIANILTEENFKAKLIAKSIKK